MQIDVIIPAYNEEQAIGHVIQDVPKQLVREIVVVNNNSTDATATVAQRNGATVLNERMLGYGAACLKGIEYLKNKIEPPEVVVFMDGDRSDHASEMDKLVAPITNQGLDLVIGSRVLGKAEGGSLTPVQRFGNWLATLLLKLIYGAQFTDLGPFRAVKFTELLKLKMNDKTYGWTVEMQLKATKKGMRCGEVPVNYRNRIGESKISGTLKGSVMAGYKILTTIFKYK